MRQNLISGGIAGKTLEKRFERIIEQLRCEGEISASFAEQNSPIWLCQISLHFFAVKILLILKLEKTMV